MSVWLYALVMACEQVAPHGDPLQPVEVAPQPADDGAEPNPSEQEDATAEEDEVFQISSEELLEAAGQTATEEAPTDAIEADGQAGTANGDLEPVLEKGVEPIAADPVPASAPAPTTPASAGWGEVIGKKWPVRLVTTVPNATPPRAILGLPDGREVVVNPGSMVPDMGLVVVAIAPNSAELARIAPAGDHATIETMTLRAQY